jgi:hypothetical protein
MPEPLPVPISDVGGFAVQPDVLTAVPPARIVTVVRPDIPANPWAQPTAYRAPTDQYIGPVLEPPFPNDIPNPGRYAPTIVNPAAIPQFVRPSVFDPSLQLPGVVLNGSY